MDDYRGGGIREWKRRWVDDYGGVWLVEKVTRLMIMEEEDQSGGWTGRGVERQTRVSFRGRWMSRWMDD